MHLQTRWTVTCTRVVGADVGIDCSTRQTIPGRRWRARCRRSRRRRRSWGTRSVSPVVSVSVRALVIASVVIAGGMTDRQQCVVPSIVAWHPPLGRCDLSSLIGCVDTRTTSTINKTDHGAATGAAGQDGRGGAGGRGGGAGRGRGLVKLASGRGEMICYCNA